MTQDMVEKVRRNIAVVPVEGGGVQIEFHACGVDFEAELSPEGHLLNVLCEPSSMGGEPIFDRPRVHDPEKWRGGSTMSRRSGGPA